MGIRDRVLEAAGDRFGISVVPRERLDRLQESDYFLQTFREEITEVAYTALNMVSGRPNEMLPEARERLARRSRIALSQDPLAGAEAQLLANFAFGRGIAKPEATDKKVQTIIDEAWSDPVNAEKLTGFEAQRHRSNELVTQANLLPTAYIGNGKVRLGFLDVDLVKEIICDPEDDERPLYYATQKRTLKWDFKEDRAIDPMLDSSSSTEWDGRIKLTYYPHWRNVEDLEEEHGGGLPPDLAPPVDKVGDGFVYHLRINRIGRTQWGTPPWARTLRFYSAMNSLTEAHVAMAQAASSIIAKQGMTGGPETIRRQASSLLSQTGELGAARFGEALKTVDAELGGAPGATAFGSRGAQAPRTPIGPAAFWNENQSSKLESVNLSSGAGQAQQTASIVRAPISAAAQFGQHYLGDASNANLATATSLELPGLMNIQAWQETFEQLYRWFIDLVIQEAVRAGRLGGYGANPDLSKVRTKEGEAMPLSELCLKEADHKEEMQRRTGVDLSYTFEMPYPGRRNLPDVVALATGIAASYDPNGINVPLRRQLLGFLAKHGMQLEDPAAFVDEVMPDDMVEPGSSAFLPKGYQQQDPSADPNADQIDAGKEGQGKGPNSNPGSNSNPGDKSGGSMSGPNGAKTGNTGGAMAEDIDAIVEEAVAAMDASFLMNVQLPLAERG